jgi:hypothetical protein
VRQRQATQLTPQAVRESDGIPPGRSAVHADKDVLEGAGGARFKIVPF